MTRDDIIRMAHEAWPEEFRYDTDDRYVTFRFDELARFAALVAAAERAECAKVCEEDFGNGALNLAAAIRGRSA